MNNDVLFQKLSKKWFQFILDNPNKPWKWSCILQNSMTKWKKI